MKSVVRAQTQMDLWEINYEKWRWQRMNLHMSSWRESGWIRKIHCVENTSMRENILIGWIVCARWWRRGYEEEATAQRCRASLEMRRKRGRERLECPTDTIALLTSAHTFLAFLFISHINRHRIVSHMQILARILSDLLIFLLKSVLLIWDLRSREHFRQTKRNCRRGSRISEFIVMVPGRTDRNFPWLHIIEGNLSKNILEIGRKELYDERSL